MARPSAPPVLRAFPSTVLAAIIALGAVLSAPAVPAQEAEGALEEVIVTATRRAENLQSVPIAVNVMDSDYLAAQHIDQIKDVIDK